MRVVAKATFTDDQLRTWAWRIPFLSGIVLGVVAIWIRKQLHESEQFLEMKAEGGKLTSKLQSTAVVTQARLLNSSSDKRGGGGGSVAAPKQFHN